MIFNVILYKNLRFIVFFTRIFAYTGQNLLFSHLITRIFVSRKYSEAFGRNISVFMITNERVELS